MASTPLTEYSCDNCGRVLPSASNHVVINTDIRTDSAAWSRLRVTVHHHHGSHNDGNVHPADLCKSCAVALLTDALARVREGERVSAGVDAIEMQRFR